MSKRPRIKQADGSLLDLPLDAETIQGKGLDDIALKDDIDNITNGNIIVKKAEQDSNGNIIKDTYLPKSGGTMTGDLDMGMNSINGVHNITSDEAHVLHKMKIYSDGDDMSNPPNDEDIDTTYYSKGIEVENADSGEVFSLYFPQKTGTFALLEDLENLGGGSSGSSELSLKLVATMTDIQSDGTNDSHVTYPLDNTLEEGKLYLVKRYSDGLGDWTTNIMLVNTKAPITVINADDDTYISATLYLMSAYVSIISTEHFYNDQYDELYVYEVVGGGSSSGSSTSSGTVESYLMTATGDGSTLELDVEGYQSIDIELMSDISTQTEENQPDGRAGLYIYIGHNDERTVEILELGADSMIRIIADCETGYYRVIVNDYVFDQGIVSDGQISYILMEYGFKAEYGTYATSQELRFLVKGVIA